MCELLTNAYLAVCSVVLIWYGLFCIIEAVHIEIIDLLVKVKSHYTRNKRRLSLHSRCIEGQQHSLQGPRTGRQEALHPEIAATSIQSAYLVG